MAITTNGKVSITNLQVGSSADLASIISDESGTGVLAFTNSPTFTTPALGTPSALVLTNATGTPSAITLTNGTGLPVSGITASTSTAIGVGSIELGHATDTTIARSSAGVVTIEGAEVVTTSGSQTLTNKILTTPVISSITNTGTLTLPTTTGTIALTSDITVTASSTTTLSNKTIALGSNTVSGTIAEFNTAVTDADLATLAGSETLSNKTLTAPKFADLGFIADQNGNELIILDTVASAVNEVTLANAATGETPTLTASGSDTNIGITLTPKGSGNVTATALVYTQTLNTPSFSTNAYTLALTDQGDILLASNSSTAGTINIPTNASVAFPTGTQITIVQTGSGQITIQATSSGTTTVNSTGATATAPKLRAQYSSATCVKTATDTWLVIGDIA